MHRYHKYLQRLRFRRSKRTTVALATTLAFTAMALTAINRMNSKTSTTPLEKHETLWQRFALRGGKTGRYVDEDENEYDYRVDATVPYAANDRREKADSVKEIAIDHHSMQIVKRLFGRYLRNGEETWGVDDMFRFLHIEQQEDISLEKCRDLMIALRRDRGKPVTYRDDTNLWSVRIEQDDLIRYLFSHRNSVIHPSISEVYMPMTRPLSHYLISSSHNTYLIGNQISSASSTDAYRTVLLNACRCIEIDCHDGPNGEPLVFHGRTLTAAVSFTDVLRTIKKYAFSASPYPLIISLEVHCSRKQQRRMAELLRNTFADMLFTDLDPQLPLPSPESLKHKILLQGELAIDDDVERNVSMFSQRKTTLFLEPSFDDSLGVTRLWNDGAFGIDKSCTNDSVIPPVSSSSSQIALTETGRTVPPTDDDAIGVWSRQLYGLIAFRAVPFLHTVDAVSNSTYQLNLSEVSAFKKIRRWPSLFHEWNKDRLTRVYPKGTRIFSGNYSPLWFWQNGVQIVSLNFQTNDRFFRVMRGMFRDNGNVGYLLQERFMNGRLLLPGARARMTAGRSSPVNVKILSYLPLANDDPTLHDLRNLFYSVEVTSESSLWKVKQVYVTFHKLFQDVKLFIEDEFESLRKAVGVESTESSTQGPDGNIRSLTSDIRFFPWMDLSSDTLLAGSMTGVLSFILESNGHQPRHRRRNETVAVCSFPAHALRLGYRFAELNDPMDDRIFRGGMLVKVSLADV